ncbi:hypothetical protein MRB53_030760 [Persea americana]|uniref:Uncharacterized protein n=1 Tax=Persea americana TaxID=3435 RepID=A0ACC2KM85_PERAE|nr:hypothetical protein MRB53_030760 [Persea americana]
MKSRVFPALKFSYDHLGDQKIKDCFLYCSIYPEGYEIDIEELARVWVANGFIGDGVDLVAASDKGYHILDRIKDACLLEGGRKGDKQFVKMHSLVRDMLLWITSPSFDDGPRFLVRAGLELREPPQEEMWREKERISLMRNEITSLPFKPDCPNLVSFSVRENPYLTTIHSSFFESMSKLSHLDLSFTAIESLPMSIGSVQGLRYLSLRGCEKLSDITHLPSTQHLRFLDLSHSGIISLPQVVARLTNLMYLNLSFMKEFSTMPDNLISAAPNLEELILYGTSINWAGVGEQDVRKTRLAEVATLEHLHTLEITIPDPECVAEDFHRQLPTLDRFKISIGPNNFTEISLPCAKQVHIHASGSCSDGVKAILAHAEGVFLNGTETKHFSQIVGNSKNLRIVRIEACHEMESFINWRDVGDGSLQNIEELRLYEIPALKKIFDGEAPQKLQKLRAIVVYQCNSLKYLFSSEMVQYLDHLELLFVSHCEDLEEIIDRDELLPDNPLPRSKKVPMLPRECPGILPDTDDVFTGTLAQEVWHGLCFGQYTSYRTILQLLIILPATFAVSFPDENVYSVNVNAIIRFGSSISVINAKATVLLLSYDYSLEVRTTEGRWKVAGDVERVGLKAIKTPKTPRAKRELEKRAPKLVENGKKTLILQGTNTSNVLNSVLTEIYHLKKGTARRYTKKKDNIRPFESGGETSLEFFFSKRTAVFLCLVLIQRNGPTILFLEGLVITTFMILLKLASKISSPWSHGLKHLKEVLLDLFREEVVENLNLAGIDRV